ncbi:MAG: L,D-transpeptidase family protein [Gammaproteobacteria bacterium]|nr:L,D-transpeptidase family protein [Gammaproteobacteria bacterium]
MKKLLLVFLLLLNIVFLPAISLAGVQTSVQELLRGELENNKNARLIIGQSEIVAAQLVRNVYQHNDYQLFWKQESMVDLLLGAIENSINLGLIPDDYHYVELKARMVDGLKGTDAQRAQLDVLLTDALVRLVYHLSYGKVVPGNLDPDWNFSREFLTSDPVAKLHYTLHSEQNLKKFLEQNIQLGPFYQGLVKALAHYRRIQNSGGWKPVPPGPVIKPGMQDSRVPLIIARLQASGDLAETTIDENNFNYTAEVEAGVKHFQQRHQLEVDGVIGKGTLGRMNVMVEQRIDQIRANLERVRWVHHNLGDEYVLVNIAGYRVYYVKDKNVAWESRVQVGKDYRKTPVFRDNIKYLVFNPTWTVPPTILKKDVLPKIKKDRAYLQKKNMNVIDLKGNIIDPSTINWSSMSAKNFPYMIRQEPGPANALGRVKIMFPNKHQVYLHDTPSKSKFNRAERAFSSGCIRVEKPFELVELLLKDKAKWNQTRFKEILDSEKLQNVSLPQTVPVLLLYFTTRMDANGQVIFYNDLYKRDENVIQGLEQPFRLVAPDQKKT